MRQKLLEEIKNRIKIVVEKHEKGVKRAYDEWWAFGFLVALVDYKVITEDEYRAIRDSINWKVV